ncbi:hypothetical protein SNE40_013873 [Patella caerulea]|uniref:Dual specificity protein phosphatase n=1 Tax=Patella caerulea TaxID=87958 RepID=A0AAN8JDE2_PATCE
MPCLESVYSMTSDILGDFYSPDRLHGDIKSDDKILMLDCRCQSDYARSHVVNSINVTLPSLLVKRLRKGILNMSAIIHNNEDKDRFNKYCKTHLIVLYDECSTDLNANPSSIINLLVKKLRQDGCRATFLLGGFTTFVQRFPEFCVSPENSENSIVGLCNLRISEDSAYGTSSDSENDGTPCLQSPFPVQVLPHLYLGNAKNSADLNQLKQNGIRYILNVTPNVPNMFANDDSFKYRRINISDHLSQDLSEFFPEAIAFIDEARENNCGVLVHCLAGISRSVTVTVAYLMSKRNMTMNEAYDFVKRCKPNISPNFNFMGQLLDFEKILHGDNSPSQSGGRSQYRNFEFCNRNTMSQNSGNEAPPLTPASPV